MQTNTYADTETQSGLLGIRNNIGMYLGGTSVTSDAHAPRALTQMLQETISNSRDEMVAGYGDAIDVVIHADNSVTVTDKGRGIPKGPDESFDTVIRSFTVPHTSGKFSSADYASAGVAGMHGIGMKAVNAASEYLTINAVAFSSTTGDDGKPVLTGGRERYSITFKQDEVVSTSRELVSDDTPTGTSITFMPDGGPISPTKNTPVLASTSWVYDDLEPILESTAFLMPGMAVTFFDERHESAGQKTWFYENGLVDYVKELIEGQTLMKGLNEPIVLTNTYSKNGNDFSMTCAIAMTQDTAGGVYSFVNGVPTKHGGPHVDGLRNSVVKAVTDMASKLDVKIPKNVKITDQDVFLGLTCAFEMWVPGDIVEFEGQTKDKLGTEQARYAARDMVYDSFMDWLGDHMDVAEDIISSAVDNADSRVRMIQERTNKAAAKKSKKKAGLVVSSKLESASSRNIAERELYIVEGDSASEIRRNPRTQAVFPIRGKVLNVDRADNEEKALKNTEVSTIVSVLGAGFGPSFNIDDLQYGKVIIATDADSDGSHIRMLLFTLFNRYMPELIRAGKLYALEPPLYKAEKYVNGKRDIVVAYTDTEMEALRENLKGYDISRYKGLGQMGEEEAHRYIADPEHRVIRQLTIDDESRLAKAVNTFMGDNASLRKSWIDRNLELTNKDI